MKFEAWNTVKQSVSQQVEESMNLTHGTPYINIDDDEVKFVQQYLKPGKLELHGHELYYDENDEDVMDLMIRLFPNDNFPVDGDSDTKSLMSESSISNFKVKGGSEGPKHDPYGYNEYSFTQNGKNYIVHMGLAQWIKIDGSTITATGDDYDNEEKFLKKHGVDYKQLQKLMSDHYSKNSDYDDPMGPPSRYI